MTHQVESIGRTGVQLQTGPVPDLVDCDSVMTKSPNKSARMNRLGSCLAELDAVLSLDPRGGVVEAAVVRERECEGVASAAAAAHGSQQPQQPQPSLARSSSHLDRQPQQPRRGPSQSSPRPRPNPNPDADPSRRGRASEEEELQVMRTLPGVF
eukprot:TRINITY_DN54928_c0_g1_i1.p1 TRINITY_DN54928_c0_g1~~TRINITY_DN54928_c0_g1_i1.p1  ORF type:complete len:154 (-),score=15.92 TRINITY_DN54928_c0_g1_i1:291-752(-)